MPSNLKFSGTFQWPSLFLWFYLFAEIIKHSQGASKICSDRVVMAYRSNKKIVVALNLMHFLQNLKYYYITVFSQCEICVQNQIKTFEWDHLVQAASVHAISNLARKGHVQCDQNHGLRTADKGFFQQYPNFWTNWAYLRYFRPNYQHLSWHFANIHAYTSQIWYWPKQFCEIAIMGL